MNSSALNTVQMAADNLLPIVLTRAPRLERGLASLAATQLAEVHAKDGVKTSILMSVDYNYVGDDLESVSCTLLDLNSTVWTIRVPTLDHLRRDRSVHVGPEFD